MTNIALHEEVSDERSLEELEDEIATLSATIQAATYRLLCLVEEYDRRGGWADPLDANGFRSVAHWLSWRVGLSLPTARQQVAVARKLPEMPMVSAAFETGELSYSKVRAISRVVSPENEETLLEWARAGTASHLERIVREYRRSRSAAETELAREQETSRCLTTYWDNDGMLVVTGRLPPEQGALLLKALDTSKDELLRSAETSSPEHVSAETSSVGTTVAAESGSTARCGCHEVADALPAHVSAEASKMGVSVVASPEAGSPPCRSRHGTADSSSAHVSAETSSAGTTPAEAAGSPSRCGCREVADDLPEHVSAETLGAGTTSPAYVSAEASTGGMTRDRTTGPQLMADALARVAERALAHGAGNDRAADRFQVVVHVDAEVLAEPKADGRCSLEDGPHIAPETMRRLTCDCTLRPMWHGTGGGFKAGRKSRVIGTALRRALVARDGTRCAFPGCHCRARDAHHIQHWADGGPTVLANTLGLCRAHHVFVHERGYRVEPLPGGGFRFLRPDGCAVPASPPLPAVPGDATQVLTRQWLPPDASITPSAGRPTWQGELIDYDWAVETLWMYGRDSLEDLV